MAGSKIKKSVTFGDWQGVSWGFTTPSPGFIKLTIQPNSAGAYCIIKSDGSNYAIGVSEGGYDTNWVLPIKKGATITQGETYNCRTVMLDFMPI